MPQKYPQSFQDRAVRMVMERLEADDAPTPYVARKEIAPKLGVAPESLRRWCEKADVDDGRKPGLNTDAAQEIRRLKRENTELRRANEVADSSGGRKELCELL